MAARALTNRCKNKTDFRNQLALKTVKVGDTEIDVKVAKNEKLNILHILYCPSLVTIPYLQRAILSNDSIDIWYI